MNGATDRMPRLLALVPYFLARPGIEIDEAARDFGISVKQLRKDLELLWMCGLPGYGPGDLIDLSFEGDTVTVTYDAGMNRPLRLTGGEATALLVALQALAETPGVFDSNAVYRTIGKIEAAVGQAQPSVVVGASVREGADATRTRELLQQALTTERALRMEYYTASRDKITQRTVDPMRLVMDRGSVYLEAWCRLAGDVRMFRLDRIDHVELLDEPATPPAHAQRQDTSTGVFTVRPEQPAVELVLSPAARWVAEYYPCEELAELPQGQLKVRMHYSDQAWMVRLVLGLGGEARVVSPPELADAVRGRAREALRRTRHVVSSQSQ